MYVNYIVIKLMKEIKNIEKIAAGQLGTLLSPPADTTCRHRLLLYKISFLPGFGFELQFEFSAAEMVVSAALHTGHHSNMKNVFHVPLALRYIVKKMPIF